MKNLEVLNKTKWYRFLKVLYFLSLMIGVIVFIGSILFISMSEGINAQLIENRKAWPRLKNNVAEPASFGDKTNKTDAQLIVEEILVRRSNNGAEPTFLKFSFFIFFIFILLEITRRIFYYIYFGTIFPKKK